MTADPRDVILVLGATGETGRLVVSNLTSRGRRVRALCREEARARTLLGPVELHRGDVRDAASLQGIATNVHTVISCLGTRNYFGANNGAQVDAIGTRNLTSALDGVAHLIYLSAFGLDRKSPFLTAFSTILNRYFHWKSEAESTVRRCGVPYTIVRPVELRNRPARTAALLNQREPLSLLRTVSRSLVADVLVACIDRPGVYNTTFELCEGGTAPLDAQFAALLTDAHRPIPSHTPLW